MLSFAIFAILIGLVTIIGVYLWSWQRARLAPEMVADELMTAIPVAPEDGTSAVLVTTAHGRVIHVNEIARLWLNVEAGLPDVEYIMRLAQPSDNFLGLLTKERRAAFRIGDRWLDATSHRVPGVDGLRTVVVMRELESGGPVAQPVSMTQAIQIIDRIGETITADMSLNQVAQVLLEVLKQTVGCDAGEICLWDAPRNFLDQRGWLGDTRYLLTLAEMGGGYEPGQGVAGWIAQHRRPVLIHGRHDPISVQTMLDDNPYTSVVAVPLTLNEQFLGTLSLFSYTPGRYNDGHIALLDAVTRAISLAIYNAQIYARQGDRIKDIASLQAIAEKSKNTDDASVVFAELNQRIAELMNADMCGIFLHDARKGLLVPQLPFHGLPNHVAQMIIITLTPGSQQMDIWENQPYWLTNDAIDEPLIEEMNFKPLVEVAGIHNTGFFPLQIGGDRIGMLAISNLQSGQFTPSDVQSLVVLATQAAIVVENLRLRAEERRIDRELDGLQEMTFALQALSQGERFFAEINERYARLLGVEMCGILTYDEEAEALVSQPPFYGVPDEIIRHYRIPLPPGSVMEEVWTESDVWYSNRVSSDPLVYEAGLDGLAELVGVRQTMLALMVSSGRRIGIMQASNKRDSTDFDEDDARLARIFATQASAIIENARLYQEIQRRAEQAETLRRVAEMASSVLTTDQTFQPVLGEIARFMKSTYVAISVLDQTTNSLINYPRWVYGIRQMEPIIYDITQPGFEHSVALSGRTFLSNDVRSDRRVLPAYQRVAERYGLHNVVMVPLLVGDRNLGELAVANREDGDYFDEDVQSLRAVASQISAAVERLLLYEATGDNLRRRVQELDAIARVSNELTSTVALDRILETICNEVRQATDADGATVILLRTRSAEEATSEDIPGEDASMPSLLQQRVGDLALNDIAEIEWWAATRGTEPLIVTDYADSRLSPQPADAMSAVAAPILFGEQVSGVLHVYRRQARFFDERAAGFLMTMAAKAAQGIQNAESYREQVERGERLRQRVGQLNRIFELGQMIQSSAGTDTVMMLEAIAYSVQQSAGFDTVLMLLNDDRHGILRREAHAGMPLDAFEQTRDRVLSIAEVDALLRPDYQIQGTLETFFFPIEKVDEWYVPDFSALSTAYEGNRSLDSVDAQHWRDGDTLVVRITGQGGGLLGLMVLDRPHNNLRPDRASAEVLEIFAHQASAMIENTRLFRDSQRSAQQEARLNEVMNAIASTLELPEIAKAISEGLTGIVPSARLTVVVPESDGSRYEVVHVEPDSDGALKIKTSERETLGGTAVGRTFVEARDYLYTKDSLEAASLTDLSEWQRQGEAASLLLPLVAGGEVAGVLHIGTQNAADLQDEENQRLLHRLAQLVASSVQNARLFNQAINLQILNRSVVESIQQGIVVLDEVGRIINFNDFMRAEYNWDRAALKRHLFDFSADWAEFMKDALVAVLEDGTPRSLINQMTPGQRSDFVVRNFYLYPLRAGEQIKGAVLLVEDVTERTQLEKAIESRANQLAALTEVSTRITSSLERSEVVQIAMEEIGWIVPYDTLTVWRRVGAAMQLEGSTGFPQEIPEAQQRILIREVPRVEEVVEGQHIVSISDDVPLALSGLPGDDGEVRSWMGVPLISQGHVSGMLAMASSQPLLYESRSEQHVASAFASQVAIALANADLFEQTFERTNEMGIMLEAAQATSMTRSLPEVFRTVAELMFSALDMEQCSIQLWDEVDESLDIQFSVNRSGQPTELKPGMRLDMREHPARRRAINAREVVVMLDVPDTEPQYPHELEELRQAGYGARMLIPLIFSDRPIGLVQLEQVSPDAGSITPQRVRLARALGSQVAIAIENARLSTETTIRFEELLTINSLSQAISSTLNLDDMLPIIRDQLPAVTGATEMYLALYNPSTQMISFPLAVSKGEESYIPSRQLGKDEVSYIIRNRHSLSLGADYFSVDELRRSMGITNAEGDAKSYMGVPLISGDTVLGVLAIRDTERTRAFDINADRILGTVASQLAAAIQNARLFEQIQEARDNLELLVQERTDELEAERDRLDTLYQITSELTRTLDMEQLLDRALGMVSKAVGADDGVIMLVDPATDELFTRAWLNPNTIYMIDDHEHPGHAASSLANWIIMAEESDPVVVVDDLHEEPYWDKDAPHAEQARSALAVILDNNDEPVGVMVLLGRQPGAFTENHLKLLVPAANQVAAAINSADLYQLIRDQAARMARLLRSEQESSQKNSAILESITDGVLLADADGVIILFNAAAERILQLPREEALGQPVSKLAGLYGSAVRWSEMIAKWMRHTDADWLTGEEAVTEDRIQLGDRVVSASLAPVYTGDNFLGTVSVLRDITRDVEADRVKSEFIENVSHEFRTPLTPIKGYTDLLLMSAGGLLSDGQRGMIQTIKDNVERLTALVDDVLNIAQLDRSGMLALMQQANLGSIIVQAVEDISGTPDNIAKQLDISVNIADDLPIIRADREKLAQIMVNVIDNAYNYTLPGGRIRIEAYREPDGEHVMVTVTDSGVGIPDEFKERAWRRFERYDQHALELDVAGTGLGLPLVKDLVALHRGEVWFESELNRGTTFFIRLPIEQPDYLLQSAKDAAEAIRSGIAQTSQALDAESMAGD